MTPTTRQWLELIVTALFTPEDRRIDKIIADLNQRNCELKGKRFIGFRHQGNAYIPEANRSPRLKAPLPSLAFELVNDAQHLLRDIAASAEDKTQIRQALVRLLDPCMTRQEIRDALPDCVVALVPELAALERRAEVAWSLTLTDPRTWRQYQKLLPKIEMYAVSRLLY